MLDQATALMDRPESTSSWDHASFASFGAQHLAWRSPSSAVVDVETPEPGQSDAEPGGRGLFDARMLAERHPESPTALARLAAAEFAAGHRVSAERAATKVLESDSFDAPALVVATHVLASLGEFADAERAVRKVHSSASNDEQRNAAAGIGARVSLHFRPPDEVLGLLHDCDDPAGLTVRAWVLSKMGRPADAVRDLRASLKALPDNPIAWHELSYAHTLLGSHTKALKASLTASHLAPADITVVASLVALLVMKEQFTDAIRAIDRIVSRRPDSLRLIRLQAAVQNQSGDTSGALRRLRRAMRTTAWKKAEPTEREELQLDARLSSLFLKQAAGEQDRATKEAVAALKRCGYRSLDIACFVADTTSSVSDLEVLERAYAELNGPARGSLSAARDREHHRISSVRLRREHRGRSRACPTATLFRNCPNACLVHALDERRRLRTSRADLPQRNPARPARLWRSQQRGFRPGDGGRHRSSRTHPPRH